MLEKMEDKGDHLMKSSCLCLTPLQKNVCNFCLSNSKDKSNEKNKNLTSSNGNNNVFFNNYVLDIHSQKKHFEGLIFFIKFFIFVLFIILK